ncbi:hypothetical protein F0562_028714 [Nyssa sinensis]|uniref:UDP-glycosyltransferases domain-containing protein n=1 Tax=Nyssa sinensis TaxID=561372 RepID=A0A5J5B217_9ASTE|nr:hypothetical protein F0562_028714 [Nyssa sinensis]
MAEKEEIHVLMVAFSSQGHINPMLRLAKRLISKGLHVTLATTEIAGHRMLKCSSSSSTTTTTDAANSIAGINLEFFSDGFSLDYDRKTNLDHYMETLGHFGPINLSTIVRNHSHDGVRRKFSCIINNPFVPWVADVAAEHQIPCAMLWIQPCTLYAIYYRYYNNVNPFPTFTNPNMSIELPGLPLLHTEDLPSFILPSNPFGSFPKLFSQMFQNMKKLKWVLANSFLELEKNAIDSMSVLHPIKPIGPLVPSALLGEDQDNDIGVEMFEPDDACIEWLNNQHPSSVIYVSFGSLVVLSAKQVESIAVGLKNNKRPFLWVVKPPEYPVEDGSDGQFPQGFLEETKEKGLIVPWSPQIKVLSHPSVACFLSHCGWNSTLETIAAGVPVIAYPQWTDQPTNAKLIVDVLRLGVRIRPNEDGVVTSEEVEKSIQEIMSGPSSEQFKKNAAELKRAAREAVADGGSSDRNIQSFVDEIIGSSCHINPMLRLAKRLISKGLHVTLATTEIAGHRMLKSSSSSFSSTTTTTDAANSIAGINLEFFSDGFSLDYDRKTNLDHYMETLGHFGPINLSTIVRNHSHGGVRRKFSCIINNPFVPWVADVAAEHQIPCAMLWIQPCTLYAIYYRYYNNVNPFPTFTNPNMSIELPGLPLLHTEDLPSFILPSNPFGSFPKLFSQMFQNMKKLKWVLANSFLELEKNAIDSMSVLHPIKPIGPLVPSALLGEDQDNDIGVEMFEPDDACIEWLNNQNPSSVIYVSFGSLVVLSAKQVESIAIGLKNKKRPFLWVVKPPEYPVEDGSDGQFPQGFLEETKEKGLIVPWSPQIKVLSHPSVACFLSHCGWNSTLETIAAGVPIIAYPQWTDQPTNAKLIVDVLRLGVRIRPNEDGVVTSEEVEKSIQEIMSGPSSEQFKKNAAELKRAAREAAADGGSSDRNIQSFVDEIIGSSCA